jgi:two-component system, OmpR family, phosphate regulon sensor histidine kinase PhoR
LSFLTALIISVPISLCIFIFKPVWWVALLFFLVILLGSYGLILVTLEKFIYRKIKLIYKFIYQTKASKRQEMFYNYVLPPKSIDEVQQDVEAWAVQKQVEIDLLQRNEVFRREFLQNLSHELKTPVFAIQGYVDTLLDGAMEDPQVAQKFLINTSKNINRMVLLMNDLSAISKLETGEYQLVKSTFSIKEAIKDAFEQSALLLKEKNIRTGFKRDIDVEDVVVLADRERIMQVLHNLLGNAIKYGKENGKVLASVYKTDEANVLVEIEDDGIGIAEEHLPRIFERFYRTDIARSRKEGGSGLGLAICKHIVEAHGHTMHVRSKPDVGTTIGFTLASGR